MKVDTPSRRREEGAGGRHRVPPGQPPARLPGVRQGRRVPAAGPVAQPRSRREPVRGGEAALREADPDQRARVPRPGAVHPVRPLHPLRRRGGRRPADQLHPPGQPDAGEHVPRRARSASYFSGNTVQICPVGALTAKPYRFKARPWDLSEIESTCTGCAVGCRIVVQSSRDEVVRYLGVDSDPVNWGWLCDKGRFGYEAIEQRGPPRRAARPQARATATSSSRRRGTWPSTRPPPPSAAPRPPAARSSIAVLGGAHGTNEDAYAWAQLAKDVIGTDQRRRQLGDGLPAEACSGCRGPRSTRSAPPPRSCCSGRT